VRWRCALVALGAFTLASSVRVAAQSADTTTCHASVEQKAVVGRVIDNVSGSPKVGLSVSLVEQHPDTDSNGYPNDPVFGRRADLDASGQFCFADLRAGDYRFQTSAMGYSASHQAILIHLGDRDSLQTITLRYRPYGRSPEEEREVAKMLRTLDDNQRRWVRRQPRHYLLRVKHECFCLGAPEQTYEVLDGVAVAAIDSVGVRRALNSGAGGVTVDSLFEALRRKFLD
jgi:hypothetical protein